MEATKERTEPNPVAKKAGPRGSVKIDRAKCKGCGLCVVACPKGSLALSEGLNVKGYPVAEQCHPDRCTGCALCALMCPDVAIRVEREKAGGPRSVAAENNV